MTPAATILYEDTMLPSPDRSYPLHDLVMRLVEDRIDGPTWTLRKLVYANPRRGIDKLLRDLSITSQIAGPGKLLLLVDRDRIASHLRLDGRASDEEIRAALAARSDAPERISAFFLYPNLEGLLRSVQRCDPALLPEVMARALRKQLNDRDIVLKEVGRATRLELRSCLLRSQPGLDALRTHLGELLRATISVPAEV